MFFSSCSISTGVGFGTFSTVSGTARMVPAEAPKMFIGSKRSAPVDKTLKATLLTQSYRM